MFKFVEGTQPSVVSVPVCVPFTPSPPWPPSAHFSTFQAVSLLYFTVTFNADADRFFFFWFSSYLLYVMGISMSLMLSLLMPNHQVLMILFGVTQNMWW
jgi:hypothetical protein